MTKRCLSLVVFCSVLCARLPAEDPAPAEKEIREAVVRALPLLRKGAAGHREQRTCFACHNQGIPVLAMTTARSRGLFDDEKDLREHLQFIDNFLFGNRDNYFKGRGQGGQVDTAGYALWTLALGGHKPNETTEAVVEYMLLYQKDASHYTPRSNRPPSEASHFTTNYLALRSMNTFGSEKQKPLIEQRTKSIREWLVQAPAKDTEDRVFRLWALKSAGAEEKEVRSAARELLATQRDDGGWAQLDGKDSDAYATGSALVALHEAGVLTTTDDAYRRGIRYLLKAQLPDGSWHVRSRSKPFQTYYESGFPHGKDQFISVAASGWATTALLLALPPVPPSR